MAYNYRQLSGTANRGKVRLAGNNQNPAIGNNSQSDCWDKLQIGKIHSKSVNADVLPARSGYLELRDTVGRQAVSGQTNVINVIGLSGTGLNS